jgi:hypothetical protein
MSYKTELAQTAIRIREVIQQFDFEHYDDLTSIMAEFHNLKIRAGFVLDAFSAGDYLGSITILYAKRFDASEEFITIEDKDAPI